MTANKITFTLPKSYPSTCTCYFSVYLNGIGEATINWGDGTVETIECSSDKNTFYRHVYPKTEKYKHAITVEIIGDITWFLASHSEITNIDVSQNAVLTDLDIAFNKITVLDISKNVALKHLDCAGNKLTNLDVSQNTALTCLLVYKNRLTSLDISKNIALENFACYGNRLTALDISANAALTDLECSDNQLTSIDVSANPKLCYFECGNNPIAALDNRDIERKKDKIEDVKNK